MAKYTAKGERAFPFVGKAPIGFVAKEASVKYSPRVAAMRAETAVKRLSALARGTGGKASIGAAKGAAGEVNEELHEDGPMFDESQIGGDLSSHDTHKNLEI